LLYIILPSWRAAAASAAAMTRPPFGRFQAQPPPGLKSGFILLTRYLKHANIFMDLERSKFMNKSPLLSLLFLPQEEK
jgi:hypothetical protein